jgi:cytochrome c-type biogenesis protein CcmF
MAETGYISLILAFIASLYVIVTFAVGAGRDRAALITGGRAGAVLVFILVSAAALVLEIALVTHNFSLEYVHAYTGRNLPLPYLISGWWAGNAGSLLFWAWVLSLAAMVFILRGRGGRGWPANSAAVIMFVLAFFLAMLVFADNPFGKLATVPPDGLGLNPLLQNPAMVIHPPLLLAGFVLFTIPFALAIGALLNKKSDGEWLDRARGWTLLAWLLLGAGNLAGAWWAYVEMGWGGYWAWDPVENAGLMPWLTATAFLHAMTVQRKRGLFPRWTMALVILTFALTIFGTWLTRSDILSSVHTFGENALAPYFLPFLVVVIVASFALLYARRHRLESQANIASPVSREGAFLAGIVLLLAATLIIFAGTISPALVRAVSGARLDIGKSFFNTFNLPVFMTIIFLAGLCVLIGWRRITAGGLRRSLWWLAAAVVAILAGLIVAGAGKWPAVLGFTTCGFVIIATLYRGLKELIEHRVTYKFLRANRDRYGAYIIHIGIALIAVGVIGSSVFATEKSAVLKPGESMTIDRYTLDYDGMTFSESGDKMIIEAAVSVYRGRKRLARLTPEKYVYRSYGQPVTEVAIRSTPAEDLYIVLADWDTSRTAAFTVLVNPLIMWLWIGGGVFFLGGLICFWPGKDTPDKADDDGVKEY